MVKLQNFFERPLYVYILCHQCCFVVFAISLPFVRCCGQILAEGHEAVRQISTTPDTVKVPVVVAVAKVPG